MKILITNNSLKEYLGTESWVYAMTKELSKEHEVKVFTLVKGKMSDRLEEYMVDMPNGDYDLVICNHRSTYPLIEDKSKVVFTSHSKFYPIEQPPMADYVGVNDYIGGDIIRNGIDCERFKPTSVNKELLNILYLSNPLYARGKEQVKRELKGYNLIFVEEERFDIETLINQADIVISMARGALESMACGKNVIYGDHRADWMDGFKGIGMITEENFDYFKSGRAIGELKSLNLKEEVKKYDAKHGEFLRERILDEFNIKKTANQYIEWINTRRDT